MEEVRRLREGQEDAALKLEKGVRRDPYIFKRRGNKNQYRFCEEVADRLKSAGSSVARAELGGRKAAFDRAKQALREGTDLISRSLKLIKFADRSEAGWAVIDEYVDDESEDEKRMEWAESMAERKLVKSRKALMTGAMYPSHESDEGSTCKSIDCEEILSPDVGGRCWDFQQDMSLGNGVHTVKKEACMGKCGMMNCVLLQGL